MPSIRMMFLSRICCSIQPGEDTSHQDVASLSDDNDPSTACDDEYRMTHGAGGLKRTKKFMDMTWLMHSVGSEVSEDSSINSVVPCDDFESIDGETEVERMERICDRMAVSATGYRRRGAHVLSDGKLVIPNE